MASVLRKAVPELLGHLPEERAFEHALYPYECKAPFYVELENPSHDLNCTARQSVGQCLTSVLSRGKTVVRALAPIIMILGGLGSSQIRDSQMHWNSSQKWSLHAEQEGLIPAILGYGPWHRSWRSF